MDLEASPAQKRQLEYATQHFDFTPDSLTDTITTFALENLENVLNGMMSHCIKLFAKKVPEHEMRESFALLQDKYTTSTEKVLEDFASYIQKNVLAIPQNVVLPEDREQLVASRRPPADGGSQMAEDLKKFDLSCQSSRGVRYKLAVVEAKMTNLKRVRELQKSGLVRQSEVLAEADRQLETVVQEETRCLDKKLDKLRRIITQLDENDCQAKRKQLQEVDSVRATLAKRLRQDSDTDSGMMGSESCDLTVSSTATTVNSPK